MRCTQNLYEDGLDLQTWLFDRDYLGLSLYQWTRPDQAGYGLIALFHGMAQPDLNRALDHPMVYCWYAQRRYSHASHASRGVMGICYLTENGRPCGPLVTCVCGTCEYLDSQVIQQS